MRRCFAIFERLTFTTSHKHHASSLFPLPSVLDSKTFAQLANYGGASLEASLRDQIIGASPRLYSRAFIEHAEQRAKALCAPLRTLKSKDVEKIISDKYKLVDDRLVTCLVPYQLAANILLSHLPPQIREMAVRELQSEEVARQKGSTDSPNKWIQWYEEDLYVSTGKKLLKRVNPHTRPRIPVFAVMGHVNHGKTALLDALQGSRVADEEPHHITQSVRAFTFSKSCGGGELFTFIDSPGHRIFVETRFHIQLVADVIILVVSVVEGVESQTHEAIKVALNVDKPVIVVLNKLDLLSDAFSAATAVRRVVDELHLIGLDVCMLQKERDVEDLVDKYATTREKTRGSPKQDASGSSAAYFAPMKVVDPQYRGSKRHPQVKLQRKCYGLCISAVKGIHIPLLWRLLEICRDCTRPTCHSDSIGHTEQNAVVQAVVLESSKHLFDEEGFRLNRSRQHMQRRIDSKLRKENKKFEQKSLRSRLNSVMNSSRRESTRQNRTSSTSLVIAVIVREGVLSEGMNFVADQAEGQVHAMVDFWGNRIRKAYPGMAVTIIDRESVSGCPGAGIHVLSVIDLATRVRVQAFRQRLQWYVEVFPNKLHYLRPRGMDVSFAHLGDYGQLGITDSLESQLLYGPPPESSEDRESTQALPPETSPSDQSIGAYLAEKNKESESNTLQVCTTASIAFPNGDRKRLKQAILTQDAEEALVATWKSLQLRRRLCSQREYEEHVAQCVQIGVLIKVDSWHTARMLHREISRLGTRRVFFQVVGARFGPLEVKDLLYFMQAVKVIVCFRTPMAASSELDGYIENGDLWVLQTDHFSDVVLFLKWCAVATHKEKAPMENNDGDEGAEADVRPHLTVESKETTAKKGAERDPTIRRQRLLLYADYSDGDD